MCIRTEQVLTIIVKVEYFLVPLTVHQEHNVAKVVVVDDVSDGVVSCSYNHTNFMAFIKDPFMVF